MVWAETHGVGAQILNAHLMPVGPAITAIIMIFAMVWAFRMVSDPKEWRYWWMRRLGYADINYNREQRRQQESQLRLVSWILLILCTLVAASCIYWTIAEYQESQRTKTDFEKTQDYTRKQLDKMRNKRPIGN